VADYRVAPLWIARMLPAMHMDAPMIARLDTEADLRTALTHLVERDPRIADLVAVAGQPPLRRRPAGFAGLASIVCSQQLSTASAAAIWKRLEAAFDPLDHNAVLAARTIKLKRAGLSMAKIKTFREIARAVRDGTIDLDGLAEMPADAAHAALISIKGVGPWTADIYLLFCIGHVDAFPAGDLALQEAARIALNKRKRPDAKQLAELAEAWRPYRGVAACVLWSYYRAVKRRDAVPVQPAA
jgi:DNA-3-methyladenine glycosylase II